MCNVAVESGFTFRLLALAIVKPSVFLRLQCYMVVPVLNTIVLHLLCYTYIIYTNIKSHELCKWLSLILIRHLVICVVIYETKGFSQLRWNILLYWNAAFCHCCMSAPGAVEVACIDSVTLAHEIPIGNSVS